MESGKGGNKNVSEEKAGFPLLRGFQPARSVRER